MKIKINNFYGSQDKYDLQLVKLALDLEDSCESDALACGWSIYNGKWYHSRLVRINLALYNKTPKLIPSHRVAHEHDIRKIDGLTDVYDKFISHKKYPIVYDLLSDADRSSAMVIYKNDIPVAATKFIEYDYGIESQFTIWDYAEPKLSLGKKIVDYEVQYARDSGHEYLYIGPGYGENSAYKAGFPGFEWWTGDNWSTDKDKYLEQCRSDDSVTDLCDLNKLYNEEDR